MAQRLILFVGLAWIAVSGVADAKEPKLTSAERDKRVLAWYRKSLVDAYDKHGSKDPSWDALAKKTLELTVIVWANRRDRDHDEDVRLLEVSEKAINAGCDDPMIAYIRARTIQRAKPSAGGQVKQLMENAEKIEKTGYSATRKAYVLVRCAVMKYYFDRGRSESVRKDATRLLDATFALLPEVAREAWMPRGTFSKLCVELIKYYRMLGGDRGKAITRVLAVLNKSLPKDSIVPLLVKGKAYTSYAWDARGGGYAPSVKKEKWKLFAKRLAIAEVALTTAWKRDKSHPGPPTAMLVVEKGQGKGKQVMQMWFKRAMSADPENEQACMNVFAYLHPRWHGSAAEIMAFGRQCAKMGGKNSRLPLMLAQAHKTVASLGRDRLAYYKQPQVWKEMEAVRKAYLKKFPKAVGVRSDYALIAYQAGKWKVCLEQVKLLGDRPHLRVFGSLRKYNQIRERAKMMAGN